MINLNELTDQRKLELDSMHRFLVAYEKEHLEMPRYVEILKEFNIQRREARSRLEELRGLGLLSRQGIWYKLEGFQLNRMGMPICAMCGREMSFANENIVTEGAVKEEEYICPYCGTSGRFTMMEEKETEEVKSE